VIVHTPPDLERKTLAESGVGVGGGPFGYAAAGWKTVVAADWNERLITVFARNFRVPILHADVGELDTITTITKAKPFAVNFGFACQPFSARGKQLGARTA
jgi:site-specific DNA-cytosine methylase